MSNNSIPLPKSVQNKENSSGNRLIEVLASDWSSYLQLLQDMPTQYRLSGCLTLLNTVDQVLNQKNTLLDSSNAERCLIGGIEDKQTKNIYPFNTQLLGEINGFASFKKLIKSDSLGLSKLMNIIPKTGPIDGWHYSQFVDGYRQWFADNGFKQTTFYPATRLLAMKRPDQFIALNENTSSRICEYMSIKSLKKQDFQRYWDEIILPIQKTNWFKAMLPMDGSQLPFYRARVALLERFVIETIHEEQNLQENSPELQLSIEQPQSSLEHNVEKKRPSKTFAKQPKKMTITQRKTAKVNQNAATKLMSQYYFANKGTFAKVDIKKHRESIIKQLIDGDSVEKIFDALL